MRYDMHKTGTSSGPWLSRHSKTMDGVVTTIGMAFDVNPIYSNKTPSLSDIHVSCTFNGFTLTHTSCH